MDCRSTADSKLSRDSVTENGIYAKLRRLKIQEEILTASANKSIASCGAEEFESSYSGKHLDLRKYINKIKKTYSDIKNLFEDVKVITKDQENLKNTDIDDIKKDIFELDEKIKSFKDFISKEICILKVVEKEIQNIQIQENPDDQKHKLLTRVHSKQHYSEVISSPVRAIIKSPFRCVEVQRFQDFMKNSRNRYGGWDEYNHNIFVNIWNKHYNSDEMFETPIPLDDTYEKFEDEVLQKVFGVKVEDVKSHTQWYAEYNNLKRCQELALNKWRDNKRKIKNPKQLNCKQLNSQIKNKTNKPFNRLSKREANSAVAKGHKSNDEVGMSAMEELLLGLDMRDTETLDFNFILDDTNSNKTYESKRKHEAFSTLYKPTTQWQNRCQGKNDIIDRNANNIDVIEKLKTPLWRIDLK